MLQGKVVLVTGAGGGIGRDFALAMAAAGAKVVVNDLGTSVNGEGKDAGPAQKVVDEIRAAGGAAAASTDSVAEWESANRIVQTALEAFGRIDVVVNNAGIGRGLSKLHEGSAADWDEMIDTNVKGLLYVTRAVVPGMVARGRGHVVNLGSVAGHEVYPGGAVYCATKHAVDAITRGLRMDLLGSGVRVTTVDPGMVETEFSVMRFGGDEARAKQVYADMTPLTGEDIADVIVWAATRPAHVDIGEVILMPTDQASPTMVHRRRG